MRSGIGFDVHRTSPGRPLWLGCVLFEGEDGLGGHSDGDVVAHALADALLGAAALDDVGHHFPDTDASVGGISGDRLLRSTVAVLREHGFAPSSCDATVICDRPAIAPARERMREALASSLGLEVGSVSVKGTRPEGLGLQGDGIGCLAIAVIV